MADDAGYPEMELDLARKATAMLEQAAKDEHADLRAWSALVESEALSNLERWDEALDAGRRCLSFDERDGNGMRFRMAALLVRTGDAKGAREMLARYDREQAAGALPEWSRALLLAKFGTDEEASASMSKALMASSTARTMLLGGDGHRERWFDRDMVMSAYGKGVGEEYMIAGMHRDGWVAVSVPRGLGKPSGHRRPA